MDDIQIILLRAFVYVASGIGIGILIGRAMGS